MQVALEDQHWYHDMIDRQTAQARLKLPGEFLLRRKSYSEYVLSAVDADGKVSRSSGHRRRGPLSRHDTDRARLYAAASALQVHHFKLSAVDGGFVHGDIEYSSVPELVASLIERQEPASQNSGVTLQRGGARRNHARAGHGSWRAAGSTFQPCREAPCRRR